MSSPELTAIDLINYHGSAAGFNNVATILTELETLGGDRLATLSEGRPQSVIRRLGWFLERYGHVDHLEGVAALVVHDREHPTRLDPDVPTRGLFNARWNIAENADIEPDL